MKKFPSSTPRPTALTYKVRTSRRTSAACIVALLVIVCVSGCRKEEPPDVNNTYTTIIEGETTDVYGSGNNSELVDHLMVEGSGASWAVGGEVVYSVLVPDLDSGDVVFAAAEAEITNDLGFNVMIASTLILADDGTDLPDGAIVKEITEANAYNITPDMHHGTFTKVGSYECPEDMGDRFVNFCMRAASSAASTGDEVTVEQDYGRLTVIVYRN